MPSFTSGPCEARRFGAIHGGPIHQFVNGPSQLQIGLAMLTEDMEPEERDANARLWAQAPEMYEVLKQAQAVLEFVLITSGDKMPPDRLSAWQNFVRKISDLLAKVEGETYESNRSNRPGA